MTTDDHAGEDETPRSVKPWSGEDDNLFAYEAKFWVADAENALRRRWLQMLTQEEREQVDADEIAAILAGRPPQSLEEQQERIMNDPTDPWGRRLRREGSDNRTARFRFKPDPQGDDDA